MLSDILNIKNLMIILSWGNLTFSLSATWSAQLVVLVNGLSNRILEFLIFPYRRHKN